MMYHVSSDVNMGNLFVMAFERHGYRHLRRRERDGRTWFEASVDGKAWVKFALMVEQEDADVSTR